MLRLAKALGPEAAEDPSLLHPLFSRLPPLWPDTPDSPALDLHATPMSLEAEANPYNPIPLSDLFQLTDKLMAQFPWDSPEIRANDIMGEGSVVYTYELETAPYTRDGVEPHRWGIPEALAMVDKNVVRPGAGMMDDEEEEAEQVSPLRKPPRQPRSRQRWLIRLGSHKFGTAIALGVVLLGIGMAISSGRAGGTHASWSRWWCVVFGKRLSKDSVGMIVGGRVLQLAGAAVETGKHVLRSMREML
jgi:hypothetical protein